MLAAHTHGARRPRLHATRWAGRRLSLVGQLGAGKLHLLALASGFAGSRVFAHRAWQCMTAKAACWQATRPLVVAFKLNRNRLASAATL